MFRRISMAALCAGAVLLCAVHLRAAAPGDEAPAFSLQDHNGKTVSSSDLKGKVVVLEWFNPGCPFVQRVYKSQEMNTLAKAYGEKGVVWLAVNSDGGSSSAKDKAAAEKWDIKHPVLSDSDGTVGKAFGAKSTPHMFIIDAGGKIAYSGALDNDPSGKKGEGKVNYVAKALDELLAGKTVSEPQTKPYGCGVHYAK